MFTAKEVFENTVIRALNAADGHAMSVAELRKSTRIKRGITSVLKDLREQNRVVWNADELTMETSVSLPRS